MHPYKIMVEQELSERDYDTRETLCQSIHQNDTDKASVFIEDG